MEVEGSRSSRRGHGRCRRRGTDRRIDVMMRKGSGESRKVVVVIEGGVDVGRRR